MTLIEDSGTTSSDNLEPTAHSDTLAPRPVSSP